MTPELLWFCPMLNIDLVMSQPAKPTTDGWLCWSWCAINPDQVHGSLNRNQEEEEVDEKSGY